MAQGDLPLASAQRSDAWGRGPEARPDGGSWSRLLHARFTTTPRPTPAMLLALPRMKEKANS